MAELLWLHALEAIGQYEESVGIRRDGRKAITEVYLVRPTDTQAAEEKRAQKCADFFKG
jgi:hypothetical protein